MKKLFFSLLLFSVSFSSMALIGPLDHGWSIKYVPRPIQTIWIFKYNVENDDKLTFILKDGWAGKFRGNYELNINSNLAKVNKITIDKVELEASKLCKQNNDCIRGNTIVFPIIKKDVHKFKTGLKLKVFYQTENSNEVKVSTLSLYGTKDAMASMKKMARLGEFE